MTTNTFLLQQLDELTPKEKAAMRQLHVEAFAGIPSLSPSGEMEWTSGDYHFTCWQDEIAISHVGVVIREGIGDGTRRLIGGIGDVCTLPAYQGKGLAATAMGLARDLMRELGVDFALLVCRPPMIPYYERRGWRVHDAPVYVRRFRERIQYTLSSVMVAPAGSAAPAAEIDLCGPPW